MLKVAVYGKGGIGKSTITSNLAAAFAAMGKKVIQIGCDPKADSTINLLGGEPLRPVMNFMREEDEEPERLEDISKEGFGGVLCIETGGPTPGLGCAGRGIIATFQLLEDLKLFETYKPDVVLYDVLGDVVCGGFAAPIREGYAEKVLIVTSGEKMALGDLVFSPPGYFDFSFNDQLIKNCLQLASFLAAHTKNHGQFFDLHGDIGFVMHQVVDYFFPSFKLFFFHLWSPVPIW